MFHYDFGDQPIQVVGESNGLSCAESGGVSGVTMKMTIVVVSLSALRKVNNEADGPCTGTKSMATAVRDLSNQFHTSSIWRVLPSMKTPFCRTMGFIQTRLSIPPLKMSAMLDCLRYLGLSLMPCYKCITTASLRGVANTQPHTKRFTSLALSPHSLPHLFPLSSL